MQPNNYSRYAYIACVLLVAYVSTVFYPKWELKGEQSSMGWDAGTYYWYLPAAFIYKDLKQHKFGDSIIANYNFTQDFGQTYQHESGNRVIRYSSGLAFMYLPAFAVAHIIAEPLGYPADGFSLPYQFAIQFWSILCAMIALWYFRKLLLYYFSDKTVAITLLLLVFGSNYLNYIAVDVTLTHSWLFSIYVLLMLNTKKFYEKPGYKYALRIGLLIGFAILIRPSEMIAAILPLLWGMSTISANSIKAQLAFLKTNINKIVLAACCTILIGSIQVIYWWYVTGEPLVYSYEDQGFSWLHPHFFDYTFSYRSGWLTYTPLLVFAFVGLIPFVLKGKNRVALIIFFLLNYYIVSAWDIWWYGGMGGRAMVQSYAILFFPIAALVEHLWTATWVKWPVYAAICLSVYINIWFTYNAHGAQGLYDPAAMTREYYWNVIGRFNVDKQVIVLKDTDEFFGGTPENMQLLFKNGFEDDSTATTIDAISGQRSVYMNEGRMYSPSERVTFSSTQADWLRAKAKIKAYGVETVGWKMIQFVVDFYDGNEKVKTSMIKINRFAAVNSTKDVYFDIKVPDKEFDSIGIFFWNPGSSVPVMVDDMELWSFDE